MKDEELHGRVVGMSTRHGEGARTVWFRIDEVGDVFIRGTCIHDPRVEAIVTRTPNRQVPADFHTVMPESYHA